ncbi:MAG: sugar phosphate isomerase/epimerase [Bryobacteraceae bacterium]|nr:sugar phosphate isomerase/epimerase [Bryobacteraceae bacterium]
MKQLGTRRRWLKGLMAVPAAAAARLPAAGVQSGGKKFRISLAEWSLHRAIFSRLMTNLEFPRIAREQFGIEGLEFVNGLWEAPTADYLRTLKANMKSTGTTGVLIMCDGEGPMGNPDKAVRLRAADNHRKWIDFAAELGCHSIRTNMFAGGNEPKSEPEIATFLSHCAESFHRLCEYGQGAKINVIIENHGGVSSDPDVLVRLMKMVNLPNFGTLPDFGNFAKETDRYEAVRKLMPYAKGVSLKCYDFTPNLKETSMDLDRLMKIVADAGYHDWVGIEYEGERLTEFEGIQAAKRYLDKALAA